ADTDLHGTEILRLKPDLHRSAVGQELRANRGDNALVILLYKSLLRRWHGNLTVSRCGRSGSRYRLRRFSSFIVMKLLEVVVELLRKVRGSGSIVARKPIGT